MPKPTRMRPLPFADLLGWILEEYEARQTILGIHRTLFYQPQPDEPYVLDLYGCRLGTPIGPAAGPHTQLAQNIACAWLCGGRFIELKTVQVLDELEIPRPCIDAADEGYNVEWSQELALAQSASEYVKAWALIHVLRRLLRVDRHVPFGTVFNASVGYDLQGIRSAAMTCFLDVLRDASSELNQLRAVLERQFPQFASIDIPSCISNNVTLSTMHGCPPEEIERIASYLLCERRLHTTVKLNPTLLGRVQVRRILHDKLGYHEIEIPDAAFEHDLQYGRALELIRSLQQVAEDEALVFGAKLSNTLPVRNHRGVLPGEEMYLSGRALYPVTANLFHRLVEDLGSVRVSYSAGADALNVTELLACGACPVTVATDLLKPGGYGRFAQYLGRLRAEMRERGARDLQAFAQDRSASLARMARRALRDRRYKKAYHPYGPAKVASGLGLFDCVTAPCLEQCPVCQDVPDYAWWIEQGRHGRALEAILARNPLPGVTGHVCPQTCQTRCTRNDYDEPVAIRDLKRFAVERGEASRRRVVVRASTGRRAAVIGAGPSGLAASYFLALNGIETTVFDGRDRPGGMLAIAPSFRLPRAAVEQDIARIAELGVRFHLAHRVQVPPEELLSRGYDAVYLACGAGGDASLGIAGIEGEGVHGALGFLERVSRGEVPDIGPRVVVIGGGNTAMDAARTAQRLVGRPVSVLYRRTRAEMPAEPEEVAALLAEGNELVELVSPTRVDRRDGHAVALTCVRNRLGPPGRDGRGKPVPVVGGELQVDVDTVIVAIGQRAWLPFLEQSGLPLEADGTIAVDPSTGKTRVPGIYAGGDLARGPATIVEACADGQRAAEAICQEMGVRFGGSEFEMASLSAGEIVQLRRRRAQKVKQERPARLPVAQRDGFALVEQTLTAEAARVEAGRCLQCRTVCDKCVEVCPNRANYSYQVRPVAWTLPRLTHREGEVTVAGHEPFVVRQERQIVHLHDLCNECGNCATFCVHQGKPYEDKPRLVLTKERFQHMQGDAWHWDSGCLWRRTSGTLHRLSLAGDEVLYTDGRVEARLSREFRLLTATAVEAFAGTISLRTAAEMAVVMEGLQASLPWLMRARSVLS
jgi:putative selenate reductase